MNAMQDILAAVAGAHRKWTSVILASNGDDTATVRCVAGPDGMVDASGTEAGIAGGVSPGDCIQAAATAFPHCDGYHLILNEDELPTWRQLDDKVRRAALGQIIGENEGRIWFSFSFKVMPHEMAIAEIGPAVTTIQVWKTLGSSAPHAGRPGARFRVVVAPGRETGGHPSYEVNIPTGALRTIATAPTPAVWGQLVRHLRLQINPTLKQPFAFPEALGDFEVLKCQNMNTEDFYRGISLLLRALPEPETHDRNLSFFPPTNYHHWEECLDPVEDARQTIISQHPTQITAVANFIQACRPKSCSTGDNLDKCFMLAEEMLSGSKLECIDIPAPSAHEMMQAQRDFKAWIESSPFSPLERRYFLTKIGADS